MHPHNFSFDLKYSDSTHSCRFTFGSERVKSSIQIVVDLWKLMRMANELGYEECPDDHLGYDYGANKGGLGLTVLPYERGGKQGGLHTEEASRSEGRVSYQAWIQPEWDSWDRERRTETLKAIFVWENGPWNGTNLRQLKSKLIEDWLALPEPSPRKNRKHDLDRLL